MVALFAATVNVVGGYFVTNRMLAMFGDAKPGGEA
ncbi:MAG: proton-translocating transhydrogenase family protein [Planctomycetota bacterium]